MAEVDDRLDPQLGQAGERLVAERPVVPPGADPCPVDGRPPSEVRQPEPGDQVEVLSPAAIVVARLHLVLAEEPAAAVRDDRVAPLDPRREEEARHRRSTLSEHETSAVTPGGGPV